MLEKYQALLAKLKEATGPFGGMEALRLAALTYARPPLSDDEQRACRLLGMALRDGFDATGAALALVEMTLPGWRVVSIAEEKIFGSPNWGWAVTLGVPSPYGGFTPATNTAAPTLPLAILIAWCEAMIAKEQSK